MQLRDAIIRIKQSSRYSEDIMNNNAADHPHSMFALKQALSFNNHRYVGICDRCARSVEIIGCPSSKEKNKTRINNGLYLSIILGNNINLTLGSSRERFMFKKDYEKFKLRITSVLLFTLVAALLIPSRTIDGICNFLLVWYYYTLTVRENILKINGSKIHTWWITHHYLAFALAGIGLTWPDDEFYKQFRVQSIIFIGCIALVQLVQYQYQSGCLRRLISLGQRNEMDITLEGFASWMFRGLTFLLPFLFMIYFFEFYNSYTLYKLWMVRKWETAWQVAALSAIFFIAALGNTVVVSLVVLHKLRDSGNFNKLYEKLKSKYPSMQELN
uniref:Ku domain-containing protein n=1 Tax=Parascaris univalens TaxID=6257 RepID=A0A915C6J4_PARUN